MIERPKVIEQLEKNLGRELAHMPLSRIIPSPNNGYSLDGVGRLIGLNLYNTHISDISFLTGEAFSYLTHLDLSVNQIVDLSSLVGLSELLELRIRDNQISDISHLKKLSALKALYLSVNHISDISPLSSILKLKELYISSNQISDLSPISSLKELTHLYLWKNQISDLSSLSNLSNLKRLDLSSNQISNLVPMLNLPTLLQFDLRKNKISHLPQGILRWGLDIHWKWELGLHGIFLEGNPLKSPPIEIIKRGSEAVRHYLEKIGQEKTLRLQETKLLIVGNGDVGKTSLMRKLINPGFQIQPGQEPTTEGINIEPWDLECPSPDCHNENVKVHFWDFGGQEIYHATHQFFLTKRSLYLFVWEARKEEEAQTFDYWLNVINLLGKESPVILVMNKSDVRIKYLDEAGFKSKFCNIVTFEQVSCLSGEGIDNLRERITHTLCTMPHLNDLLPAVWKRIRNQLKEDLRDYLSLDQYYGICSRFGLNKKEAMFLSDYLHDLGVILHFHDHMLEELVILNPNWATNAVYALINIREIQVNKGRFDFQDLKKYWAPHSFPREKHHELIQLMEKFELCFNIVGTHSYIIPELLPPGRPDIDFNLYKRIDTLNFLYEYDFMPGGILSRFISRLHYLIKEDHFWKNGVELRFEGATALVLGAPLERKITISIAGTDQRELLAIIRQDIDHIHQTLNMEKDVHYRELIPCSCSDCWGSDKPNLFEYTILKRRLAKGRNVDFCRISDDEVIISTLLDNINPEQPKESMDFLEMLLLAAKYLQGISRSIKHLEDNRNDFITAILRIKGLIVHDQTRWGMSETGRSIGRLDFKLYNPYTGEESIVEAFNLDSLKKEVVESHARKLFYYDANGLKQNFILVYCGAKDFPTTWQKYLGHVRSITFEYPLKAIEEQETKFSEIKLAHAQHLRSGIETNVFHIFIKMPYPSP